MANFFWLVCLLCVQFSRGEVAEVALPAEDVADAAALPAVGSGELPEPADEKIPEEWTEDDEKWFEEIQSLLAGDSDEDYDMDYAEFGKLIAEIEELMKEHRPDKSSYEWLADIAKWFVNGEIEYEEDSDSEENDSGDLDKLTLSWFYQTSAKKEDPPKQKRFSSV